MRLQGWRDETHSAGFELTRHFFGRFFDSEMVSTSGEWRKVAIGVFAALLSAGILVVKTYMWRYTVDVYAPPTGTSPAQLYQQWIRGDMLSLIGLAMAVTTLLTILLWQSLFPSARDCLALAGLPVSARQIFQAKFGALLLLFAAYAVALNLPPAVSFCAVTSGPLQENPSGLANVLANLAATAGACVFVFFSLLTLQGILLNVLPSRLFARVSLGVQAALFIATLGALPLLRYQPAAAAWWPPVWFLRLWEAIVTGPRGSARHATLAIALPAAASVLAYLFSYQRYRRLLLEAPRDRAARWTGIGSWLLERWIRDPREQAAFSFIWKALARSGGHRLILLAYAGIALGWIATGAVDTARPGLRDQGMYGLLVVLAPLALSMLVTTGLRYVFSVPVALSANWVFQIADREGRAAWLAAVERFVLWCGLAPIFFASLPAAVAILGRPRAVAAIALTLLVALLWFEALFRRWRKMPFTCSYLPGKKPVLLLIVRYGLALPLLGPAGQLILFSSGDVAAFGALFTSFAVLWLRLRAQRRKVWSQCDLGYEEAPEAALLTLDLQAGRALQQESVAAKVEPAAPMFAGTFVASRGRLPEAWAEEIEEDRRHPARLLEALLEDVRYAFRLIRRNPLFSAVVVLTLTVGIGVNTSIFTVVNGMAFRPHVYKDPDSFVRVITRSRLQGTIRPASYEEYANFRDHTRSLRQVAAWAHFPVFIGADNSAGSIGIAASCNFFMVDGLSRPILGRLFTAEDCLSPAQAPAAVISEALWRVRFAADPRILGRRVDVNSRPVTIVGVVPTGTAGWTRTLYWTRPASIFLPYTAQAHFEPSAPDLFRGDELWLSLAGRVAPGFSRGQAAGELGMLARQQDREHPGRHTTIVTTDGAWIRELEQTLTGQQLMLAAFLLGALNLVLVISCANVATLLLSRAAARRREIAVRLSLGAPRIRLVRMLITESLLLASMAGAASLYLAWRIPKPLFRLMVGREPDFPIPVDWRTYAFGAAIIMLTGILSGLAPALQSVKVSLTGALKGGAPAGRGFAGAENSRGLQGLLVSAQVALSMVLLVSAALFARAEDRVLRADPGYHPQKVVVAPLYFPDKTKPQAAAVKLLALAQRVKALPGARTVAFSEGLPLYDHATVELSPPGRPDVSQPVDIYSASPGFFQTLGVPILRGREFEIGDLALVSARPESTGDPLKTSADRGGSRGSGPIVVSRSLARAFWPGEDPIGKTLAFPGGRATVVGVAGDVDALRFGGSENPALYRPWRAYAMRNVISVRFDAGEAMGAAAVRAAMLEVDPNLPATARLAQTWIDQLTEDLWNVVALILLLGIVATLLAATGIYGAVSFAVNQRTKELGIRVALGAGRLDIIREVFLSGGKPVVKGLLAGLWLSVAVAAALGQSVKGSPVRLETANPLLYFGAALILTAAAVLAMIGPARRGSRSDPLDALRCE